MDTDEAIRLGMILSGPILSVVGGFFAVSISASPYHTIGGKALAWPLAPIVGLVLGARLADSLLPNWESGWAVAIMFGHGFFYCWAAIAALTHDDAFHNFSKFGEWAGPRIKRFLRNRKGRNGKRKPRIRLDEPEHEEHKGR